MTPHKRHRSKRHRRTASDGDVGCTTNDAPRTCCRAAAGRPPCARPHHSRCSPTRSARRRARARARAARPTRGRSRCTTRRSRGSRPRRPVRHPARRRAAPAAGSATGSRGASRSGSRRQTSSNRRARRRASDASRSRARVSGAGAGAPPRRRPWGRARVHLRRLGAICATAPRPCDTPAALRLAPEMLSMTGWPRHSKR